MITLKCAADHLSGISGLMLEVAFVFASLATGLKDDIILTQPATYNIREPPLFLPPSIVAFLSIACKLSPASVKVCWRVLKSSIWAGNFTVYEKMKDLFEMHGHPHGLTQRTFYPPFKMCPNSTCDRTRKGLLLSKAEQRKAVYFGHSGTVPAYSVQLYCESCKTTYHTNYKVIGDRHIYYDYITALPDIVQIADHYFVDYQIARLWKAMMHASCTSATNCAHIYNIALANAESTQFPGTKWFAKDTINQNEHFVEAMSDRNRRMRIYNQPLARRHFCVKCTRIYNHGDTANKLVSVVVVDGVVVSRPCCSIPNCWVHLRTPQDRFCPTHSSRLNQCAIKGCARSVMSGSLMCDIRAHQESEALHTLWGKSRFHLHEHLECSRAIHGRLANVQVGADDDADDDDGTQAIGEEEYDVKLGKKKRLRAQFTHNYTHCEELIVAPCGMIHARETMHNAEGVGSVAEFIRRVFRDPETRPTHVFFDNNCRLALHVQNDPFFQDIGLSVDVFHFECKHSKQDTFCQENCNPAAFPELKTDDGEWYFNSSACEQVNSWFGKFNPIT
ncbi:hypothetical protein DFJ58DRAFT_731030 [Suillus subalutaceus]|uniref:uncharacterized protein n=1 Tax=Suillus subalutaceus TaxID=48586 RepID=UPI001B85F59F|nr:uncharacterized protein DFJ58DRAFT_731030 [Suillus subalutaceus]KAG1844952.1 hypothetical protein DFJ58DRAFT_731030 [Suillus subalutaceus]